VIAALDAIFTGDWAPFGALLAAPDDPRPSIPAREALSPDALDAAMERVAAVYGAGDRRALVSLWSMHHVYATMTAGIVAHLALDHDLPLHVDETRLVLDEHGLPAAIAAPHDGAPGRHADPFARFERLIDGHVAPTVEALAVYGRVSRRVLWSNAANLYEFVYRSLLTREPQGEVERRGGALVDAPHRPDGSRNPMHQPVEYVIVDDPMQRWRRVCCLRHLAPECGGYCQNCPHRLDQLRGGRPARRIRERETAETRQ
jgi:ferric iron reductase protein FhuF